MERKYNIDLLRIVSALAVIAIHTVTSPVSNSTASLDANLTVALQCIHNLLNWSVPVFFMITGYCIFRKEECTYRYCMKHVLKFALVLLTVGFAYAMLEEVAAKRTIDACVILTSMQNVISGKLWDHMWYVYAIIGVYLVLPVLHSFMQTDKRNRLILTGLLLFFSVIAPAFAKWQQIGVPFPFGGYLFYVCFGGLAVKEDFGKKAKWGIVLSGVLAAVWVILHGKEAFGYFSLPICLIAGSMFVIINAIAVKPCRLLLTVSQCTWGMYLLHPLFINIAIKVLKIDLLSNKPYLCLFGFWVALSLLSFAATYILRKIPLLKKLF